MAASKPANDKHSIQKNIKTQYNLLSELMNDDVDFDVFVEKLQASYDSLEKLLGGEMNQYRINQRPSLETAMHFSDNTMEFPRFLNISPPLIPSISNVIQTASNKETSQNHNKTNKRKGDEITSDDYNHHNVIQNEEGISSPPKKKQKLNIVPHVVRRSKRKKKVEKQIGGLIAISTNEYKWEFDGDIANEFKQVAKGSVFNTRKFTIDGLQFYLQCTPNGWKNLSSVGKVTVWLAACQHAKGFRKILGDRIIGFSVDCAEIDCSCSIVDRELGRRAWSSATWQEMDLVRFKELNSWLFTVKITLTEGD